MSKELITLETTTLAKAKGYDEKTHDYFTMDRFTKKIEARIGSSDEYWGDNYEHNWNGLGEPFKPFSTVCYSRPSQSELQTWLRDKHNIIVYVIPFKDHAADNNDPLQFRGVAGKSINFGHSWEETLEVALQKGLELITPNNIT